VVSQNRKPVKLLQNQYELVQMDCIQEPFEEYSDCAYCGDPQIRDPLAAFCCRCGSPFCKSHGSVTSDEIATYVGLMEEGEDAFLYQPPYCIKCVLPGVSMLKS
jgi:hypothetical protein